MSIAIPDDRSRPVRMPRSSERTEMTSLNPFGGDNIPFPATAQPRDTGGTGSQIRCHCGQDNPPERRFCGQCGAELWDACPKCDAQQARNERFCGQCGLDIPQYFGEQSQWCKEQLSAARQLAEECRFEEALRLLRRLLQTEEKRLASEIGLARTLQREITETRDRRVIEAREAIERARQCFARYAYQQAFVALEAIPEPLRDDEARQLLDQAQRNNRQILALSGEIREDLAGKRLLAAMPKLDRLLKLKPDHDDARQLLRQISDKVFEAARKKLAARDFQGAAALARQIPSEFRDPDTAVLLEKTSEAIWMSHQVNHAPHATPALARVADCLLTLAPGDVAITKLRAKLAERLAAGPVETYQAAPTWHEHPTSRFPTPLVWYHGGQCLRIVDDATRKSWRAAPGRFAVACGLALQGLELASVDVNLVPRESTGLLQRLTAGRRRPAVDTAWGIDLSPTALKAILLRRDSANTVEGGVVVERAVVIPHAEKDGPPADEAEQLSRWAKTIQSFAAQFPPQGSRVCVNLPGLHSLGRWFTVPPNAGKRLDELLKYELKTQIAFPLEELAWDEMFLDGEPNKDQTTAQRVFVLAAKRFVTQSRLKLFAPLGVKIDILQSDCVALHNFALFECGPHDVVALVDLGSDVTNLVLSGPKEIWFRAFGPGGDELTRALVREFQVTFRQAEEYKLDPVRAPSAARWSLATNAIANQLAREITRSLAQHKSQSFSQPPGKLWCLGGGASLLTAWAPDEVVVE